MTTQPLTQQLLCAAARRPARSRPPGCRRCSWRRWRQTGAQWAAHGSTQLACMACWPRTCCAHHPAPTLAAATPAAGAAGRLLHALSDAQTSLRFWRNQLRSGSHGSFLLLARGPGSFLADVLAALRRPRDEDGNAAPVAASDRIEERVGACAVCQLASSMRHAAGAGACRGAADAVAGIGSPQHCCCCCCRVQVVALQLLSTQLAEGLAAVHSAAGESPCHAVTQ